MNSPEQTRDPFEQLAEDFVARYRRGEQPPLTEYTSAHPELADEIRELFPTLVLMEEAGAGASLAHESPRFDLTADGRQLERLGDYRIVREVGRGGMGVVFEAEQVSLGRHVALKVLPIRSDTKSVVRFRREARAAARLHHTNIVPVFDIGQRDGVHYYAMQFIQGHGLDQVMVDLRRLRGGQVDFGQTDSAKPRFANPIPVTHLAESMVSDSFHAPDSPKADETLDHSKFVASQVSNSEQVRAAALRDISRPARESSLSGKSDLHYFRSVARVGMQVADALSYAHACGVQHRDIKPSNLLLDARGIVWVTDFGLAKEESDDVNLTATGDVVGTLRYMAPERFHGESDFRSDVYSLGLTMYELLTLRSAFDDSDRASFMRRILHEEPPPPHRIDPRIPLDLETLVLKAMAKEPAYRFQTASQLADDLRRFLENRPILARRVGIVERTWRWCYRNPIVAGLTTAVLLLTSLLTAGLWVNRLVRADRDRAVASETRALTAEDRAVSAERAMGIRRCLAEAAALRRSGQPGRKLACLSEIRHAVTLKPNSQQQAELRNELIAALAETDVVVAKTISDLPETTTGVGCDATHRRYARADRDGSITVYNTVDGSALQGIRETGERWSYLEFSTDDRFVVGSTNFEHGRVQAWRLPGGDSSEMQPVFDTPLTDCFGFDIKKDGSVLAVCRGSRAVQVFDLSTGELVHQLEPTAVPSFASFTSDGSRLAICFAGLLPQVEVWDIENEVRVDELTIDGSIHHVECHPNKDWLSLALAEGHVEIWDHGAKTRIAKLEGHQQNVIHSRFDESGAFLISSSWDGTSRLWGGLPFGRLVASLRGTVIGPFSSNARTVGIRFNTFTGLELLGLDTSQEHFTFSGPVSNRHTFSAPCFAPNGRWLAIGMVDGVHLVNLETGSDLAILDIGFATPLYFNPNGADLVTAGRSGVARWPITPSDDTEMSFRIGPPSKYFAILDYPTASANSDGSLLGLCRSGQLLIKETATDRAVQTIALDGLQNDFAWSPNDRYVATGGWHSETVTIWDVQSGDRVHELKLGPMVAFAFTPDSKFLATSQADAYKLWDTGTWKSSRQIERSACVYPGPIAFSADGSMMALELTQGAIDLIDFATGEAFARLDDPNHDRPAMMQFSPDSSRLVAVSIYARAIHVWDLAALRSRLREFNLDWTDSIAPVTRAKGPPLKMTVDLGDLAGIGATFRQRLTAQDLAVKARRSQLIGRWVEALGANSAAIDADPDCAEAQCNLAWILAMCPDTTVRNPQRSVACAQRAVELEPNSPVYANTLGVAYYRAGNWSDAIEQLERAEELAPGQYFALNGFCLAMAHFQLGSHAKARDWYDRSTAWLAQGHVPTEVRNELSQIRVEADEIFIAAPTEHLKP